MANGILLDCSKRVRPAWLSLDGLSVGVSPKGFKSAEEYVLVSRISDQFDSAWSYVWSGPVETIMAVILILHVGTHRPSDAYRTVDDHCKRGLLGTTDNLHLERIYKYG